MSENITNVKLLYVPLDNEYKHTLYFKDLASQLSYFNSISGAKSFSDFSYQPKDSRLRIPLSLDEAMKFNYVMYQNTNYSNKYFFAFITDYEWNNENLTTLQLETDVMQTWLHNITIMPSFIEREHTKDDTIGANTLPENVEMGEYIIDKTSNLIPFTKTRIVVGVTADSGGNAVKGKVYNGCYSGISYRAFDTDTTGITKLNNFLKSYDESTDVDNNAIVCMFLAPAELANLGDTEQSPENISVIGSEAPYNRGFGFNTSEWTDFVGTDEYIPKNKKLYTYPYNYLLVSNNNGGSAIYQVEHFSNNRVNLTVYGVLTPGCSIRLVPIGYKGTVVNHEEGLNLGKYPICNWSSDEYTNWLTQNGVNIGLNLVSGLGQIIGGGAMALGSGGLGMAVGGASVMSGISGIANQLAQIHQMSFTPPQANGNTNSGDVITALGQNTFSLYQMTIKPEYRKVIDEYFSMFGYKTNRVKIPETNHRENWWFTKTIDVNIKAQIPISDLSKIKACYNNGVTFWRNATNIKNYALSNNII